MLLAQPDNWQAADDQAQKTADALEEASAGVPSPRDSKDIWAAYARLHGDEDPEAKTKNDLISEYGSQEG